MFRSEELWAYVLIVATAVAAITLDIVHMYESVGTSLHAFFQVSSIITTTGYATVDFQHPFSKAILVALCLSAAAPVPPLAASRWPGW